MTSRFKGWSAVTIALALLIGFAGLFFGYWPRDPDFDAQIERLLEDEAISGAVIAFGPVGGSAELIAYGEAAPNRAMHTNDRFRLASLAKPITAAAVLRLVREGAVGLDTVVPEAGRRITVRQLLQHSGGWDRRITFDPISAPETVARLGIARDYDCIDIADRMPPTQFDPGTRYAYSNIGYCRLGQLIERVSGREYENYVVQAILRPRGAELTYNGAPTVQHPSDWPGTAWGTMGPGGGWTGTALAYWRFASGPLDPLTAARPPYAQAGESYYGLGWRVWPDGTLSHFGAVPGVFSVVIRANGHVLVALFNGRPKNDEAAYLRIRQAGAALGI